MRATAARRDQRPATQRLPHRCRSTRPDLRHYQLGTSADNGFPQYRNGLDYADANQVSLGDRAPWGGWGHDGLFKQPHVKEQIYAIDAGLRYQPIGSVIEAVDVGVNFTRRDKKKRVDEFDLLLKNGRLQTLVDPSISSTRLRSVSRSGRCHRVDLIRTRSTVTTTPSILETRITSTRRGDIKEDVTIFKVRMQFASGDLHGNIGIQVVHQKQESTGSRINFIDTPATIIRRSRRREVLGFPAQPERLLRYRRRASAALCGVEGAGAAAHGRNARESDAGLQQQRLRRKPAVRPGQTVNPWSASGGNPHLQPWRAKAIDVSYEWYLGPASYFAIAAFYKNLDNYIYSGSMPFDFTAFPLPSHRDEHPDGRIISPIGTVTMPDNGPGGDDQGGRVQRRGRFQRFTSRSKASV